MAKASGKTESIDISDARNHKVALTAWELELTIEMLGKMKFDIDSDERRLLTRAYRDRLQKMIEPPLPFHQGELT